MSDRVKDLFFEASGLDGAQRRAFLNAACGDDAALRAQVEALLLARERAGSFLADPTRRVHHDGSIDLSSHRTAHAEPVVAEASFAVGSVIDRYRIERVLGEGGFGTVYLAAQEKPIRRRVALKVIRPGMDSHDVIRRFEAERQALAVMDHPNIARVFDAGTTRGGRPYFVMEYVDGEPITVFADSNRLSIPERLELFERVCQAVQHAHQKGVIHRDLKPSNVLVTTIDARPAPKVIDFGISKALWGQAARADAPITQVSQVVGTPQYMSPEQASADVGAIDTRTDVYSLGVLLYELLAGATPFDLTRLKSAGPSEIERVIRDTDPARPSAKAASLEPGRLELVARYRRVEPRRLRRLLRGDLDWIVMRAIEKEPERRYATAMALAADVRRYLDHEPVEAGPPSMSYRFAKFARRHRVALATGATTAAALVIGLMLAVDGWSEANRLLEIAEANETEADRQRQAAEFSQAESEAVTAFLSELLASVDPRRLGREVTIVDALVEAGRRLDEGAFADRPGIEARLRFVIARALAQLGRPQEALAHARRAADLARSGAAGAGAAPVEMIAMLARVHHDLNQPDEAMAAVDEAWTAGLAANLPERHELMLHVRKLRGDVLQARGDLDEAERIAREVLESRREVMGETAGPTLQSIEDVAGLLMEQGRVEEATPLLTELVDAYIKIHGPDHYDTLGAKGNLAEVYLTRRDYAQAERLWSEALAGFEKLLSPDHPATIRMRNNLAVVYVWQDRYEEARPLLERNYESQARTLGEDHRETLATLNNLIVFAELLGEIGQESELKERLLETRRRKLGYDHLDTVLSELSLARSYIAQARYDDAEALLTHAVEVYRREVAPSDLKRNEALNLLVDVYLAQGRVDEARPLVKERQEGRRLAAEAPGAAPEALRFYAEDLLAALPEDMQDPVKALEVLQRACEMTDHQNPDLLEGLALALHRTGAIDAAIATLEKALALLPEDVPDTRSRIENQLAMFRSDSGM